MPPSTPSLPLKAAVELAYALVGATAERAGVRFLAIKGPISEQLGIRSAHVSADADFIVEPGKLQGLIAEMGKFGWTPRDGRESPGVLPLHSITLLHPEWPCDIDLHSYYPGFFVAPEQLFDELWEQRTRVVIGARDLWTPSDAGNLIITWLHGLRSLTSSRHQAEMSRVKEIVTEGDEGLRGRVSELARTCRAQYTLDELLTAAHIDHETDLTPAEIQTWDLFLSTIQKGSTAGWILALLHSKKSAMPRLLLRAAWPEIEEMRQNHFLQNASRRQLAMERLKRIRRGLRTAPYAGKRIMSTYGTLRSLTSVAQTTEFVINGRFLTQEITGVQRFAEEIVRHLATLRSDFVLVCPPGAARTIPGVKTVVCGKHSGHLWEQVELPKYLRSQGNPLLVSLTSTAPMTYRNQISTHHDITYVRFPENFSRPFRMAYKFIVPAAIKSSLKLITVSHFSATEIASHFNIPLSSFTIIPNAASERFTPREGGRSNPDANPYFLAVSSNKMNKNFARLVEAYALYRSRSDRPHDLMIIGDSNSSFASVQEVSHEGVTFTGRVSDPQLVTLYQDALAFVFPSLYEGFGIPPLEAQQCGTPVIAARAASMPEVLGDSVLWFDPLDTGSIADALAAVADQPDLRESLSERGHENAGRFNWTNSARLLSTLIDEALAVPRALVTEAN